MKKRIIIDPKLKEKVINISQVLQDVTLPIINNNNISKKDFKNNLQIKGPQLSSVKKKFDVITKRSINNNPRQCQLNSKKKQQKHKRSYSNVSKEIKQKSHSKKQKSRSKLVLDFNKDSSEQIKNLFNDIKNKISHQRNTINSTVNRYSQKLLKYSCRLDQSLSTIQMTNDGVTNDSFSISPTKQLLASKEQSNKCTSSMVGNLGHQINRLQNFRKNNQKYIKAYLCNKIVRMNIQIYKAERQKIKKIDSPSEINK